MSSLPRGRLVSLRPIEHADLQLLHRWLNDPVVMQYWDGRDHPATFDRVESRFRRSVEGIDRDANRFMVDTLEPNADGTRRTIGMLQHGRIQPRAKNTQLDVIIGEPEFRDGGYGTDAVTSLLGYLFDSLRVHRVWVTLRAANQGAIRATEKCGFKAEGLLREHDWLEGKFADVVVYGMLASDWEELRARTSSAPSSVRGGAGSVGVESSGSTAENKKD